MIEEAIIYAFILCIFIFILIDALYRVSMNKDIDTIASMMNDIHYMLFVGTEERDADKETTNHEHNHNEIKSWDES